MTNIKATINVTVPIQISIPSSWGPGFTIAEIMQQAKEKAFIDLSNVLSAKSILNEEALDHIRLRIRVSKSDAKVKVVLEEE